MFSGGACSSCKGCGFRDRCYELDPNGVDGPRDMKACVLTGGIDCSSPLGPELFYDTSLD